MVRAVVLFVHLVGVLGLFVALALEWVGLDAVQHAGGRADALRWTRFISGLPRFGGLAVAAVLISGFAMGARYGVLGDGWMRASYATIVVMAIAGGPLARPRMQALRRAADEAGDGGLIHLQTAAADPMLRAALRLRVALALAIVYLMVAKPVAIQAAGVVGIAIVAALVLGRSTVHTRPARLTSA